MSKAEILAELPRLEAEERRQIYQRLCELQEQDLLEGDGPSDAERKLLDAALADYGRDGDRGRPWRDVLQELRKQSHCEVVSHSASCRTGRPSRIQ